jgi:hypothetical protein
MRIAGASGQQISEELGVKRRTVYLWFSDPLVKGELESQLEDISALLCEKLVANAMRALDAIEELLRKPVPDTIDVETKLSVIREILDRNPWTAKNGSNVRAGAETTNKDARLSDEELIERLESLVSGPLQIAPVP